MTDNAPDTALRNDMLGARLVSEWGLPRDVFGFLRWLRDWHPEGSDADRWSAFQQTRIIERLPTELEGALAKQGFTRATPA